MAVDVLPNDAHDALLAANVQEILAGAGRVPNVDSVGFAARVVIRNASSLGLKSPSALIIPWPPFNRTRLTPTVKGLFAAWLRWTR